MLDLVTHYPRRWLDRTAEAPISDLRRRRGGLVLVRSRWSAPTSHAAAGVKPWSRSTSPTASGHLKVTFFNQPWRQRQLRDGTEALFFGKVDAVPGRPLR